jgi:hypothetical protein
MEDKFICVECSDAFYAGKDQGSQAKLCYDCFEEALEQYELKRYAQIQLANEY